MRRGRLRWAVALGAVALLACSEEALPVQVQRTTTPPTTISTTTTTVAPEFPVDPEATAVSMPWLHRDGDFLRDENGRTFIVRGVDYAFNTIGLTEEHFNLALQDLDRIRSWGTNTVRIRVRGYRSGLFPSVPAEPGFLEELDRVIARVNERGMYVIIATGGPDDLVPSDDHPDARFDTAKFLPGTPAREHWLAYLGGIFDRYEDWPGVIGFDPINEDRSHPPDVLDSTYLEAAHRDILARLRDSDEQHVYFQQPSGWTYESAAVGIGHDLGDPNRFFCVKWGINARVAQRLAEQRQWAAAAGTPLFICEYSLPDVSQFSISQKLGLQRLTLGLIDDELAGSIRLGYLPSIPASLISQDRTEAFWVDELVRAQPNFIGGEPTRLDWSPLSGVFELEMLGDGAGTTELFIPARAYPAGFTLETSGGGGVEVMDDAIVEKRGGVTFNFVSRTATVPAHSGPLTLEIRPLGV